MNSGFHGSTISILDPIATPANDILVPVEAEFDSESSLEPILIISNFFSFGSWSLLLACLLFESTFKFAAETISLQST